MLSGESDAWTKHVDQCDKCGSRREPCLEFGGDSGFEMPVIPGSELEAVLTDLRERLGRRSILLCYRCTDDLEAPPGGPRFHRFTRSEPQAIVAEESTPRLFEV